MNGFKIPKDSHLFIMLLNSTQYNLGSIASVLLALNLNDVI